MEHVVPVMRRRDRDERGAQGPQSHPLLLLVLHRRLRAHARQAGRGDIHGQSSDSPHRRARSGFAFLCRIHAPDLLELEQRVPGRCRKRRPKGHARHDGARRGRKGGDVAQRPEGVCDRLRARHPFFAVSQGRRRGDARSGATCRSSSPTRIRTAAPSNCSRVRRASRSKTRPTAGRCRGSGCTAKRWTS